MDLGWITTFGSSERMMVQVSFASEGGSGAPVPDCHRVRSDWRALGCQAVLRHDPLGKLINILEHKR